MNARIRRLEEEIDSLRSQLREAERALERIADFTEDDGTVVSVWAREALTVLRTGQET